MQDISEPGPTACAQKQGEFTLADWVTPDHHLTDQSEIPTHLPPLNLLHPSPEPSLASSQDRTVHHHPLPWMTVSEQHQNKSVLPITDSESVRWNMNMRMEADTWLQDDFFRKRAKGVGWRPYCGISSGSGCRFTGFSCHPVDVPAHDCNHNYVARNRYATSFHILRDNWLCSGLSAALPHHHAWSREQRLHPAFCLKPSRYQNIHPTKACHRKKGEHQTMLVYGKASTWKNGPVHRLARAQDAGRCTMPPGSSSPAKTVRWNPRASTRYLCWAVISRDNVSCHTSCRTPGTRNNAGWLHAHADWHIFFRW